MTVGSAAIRLSASMEKFSEAANSASEAITSFVSAYREAPDVLTLTSKLGVFTFDRKTVLSRAKLLRDSITGQFFAPNGGVKIKDEASAYEYASSLSRDLADIPFSLDINLDMAL